LKTKSSVGCVLIIDVLCDSGEVEDVKHFLVRCEKFSWERQKLLERIGQMEGSQEWLEEYWRAEEEGKWLCCWEGA